MTTGQNDMLQQAIRALEEQRYAEARELLTKLLRVDKANPVYWVYLSAAVESPQERRFCLERALTLDPNNEAARRGLVLLGARAPEGVEPVPPPEVRPWATEEAPLDEEEESPPALRDLAWARRVALVVVALAALFFMGWGGYRLWDYYRPRTYPTPPLLIYASPDLTATALAATPSATPTPKPVLLPPGQPTPLWMLLPATYTPTPLFVNTPHPIEAYRLGLQAMARGDWEAALGYMQQVARDSNNQAADAFYYIGEAYRHLGRLQDAEQAYQQALALDPTLAPAYLGLARARLAADPNADVGEWLDQAVAANPQFPDAYLERAAYRLRQQDFTGALEDLDGAEALLGDYPLVWLYRAQVYLAQKEWAQAREAAQRAHEDVTLLPAYLALAQADFALGHFDEARDLLETYILYRPNDSEGLYLLARVYATLDEYDLALQASQRIRKLRPNWFNGLILHAQLLIGRGQPDDVTEAVRLLEDADRWYRDNYTVKFWLGRAYYAQEKPGNAYLAFHEAVRLAEQDAPESEAYYRAVYWRAKTLIALEEWAAAYRDWMTVYTAPKGLVPQRWRQEAEEQMAAIYTPTPSPSPTATDTPTPGPSPSVTVTPSHTPTGSPTPTITPSRTPSPTP